MSLRNSGMIRDKHRDILQAALQKVLDLISVPTMLNIPDLAGLSIVDANNTMGNYADNMD